VNTKLWSGSRYFMSAMASAATVLASSISGAADWRPARNVEIVVNTSPGTGSDTTARLMQQILRDRKLVDASSTVVNKVGGGGSIGVTYVAQHPGDGHYILVTAPTLLTNYITGKSSINYTDLTPLAQLGSESVVFTVKADSPIRSANDLAERLKADAGSLSISIGNSVGSHNHLAAALVVKAVGGNVKRMKVVSFSGSTEGITALLGGHLDVACSPASGVMQQVIAGRLRVLAVAGEQRLGGPLAVVPAWKELGVPVVMANWRSVVGPKGMSEEQIRYWDEAFSGLAQSAEWKRSLDDKLEENTYLNARDARKFMDAQYALLSAALSDLGLAK
jgi:putative tricarboxylic transport membrane protein